MIQGREVPRLILATVSDGRTHAVLRPDQLAEWVVAHLADGRGWLICWNAKFDFQVCRQYLRQMDKAACTEQSDGAALWAKKALPIWDSLPGQNRLRDGMLLDFLVRLADPALPPGVLRPRGLKDAARDLCGIELVKDQAVRTGFGGMADPATWDDPERREALDYAVKDAVATKAVYDRLTVLANKVARDNAAVLSREAWKAHGPLTELLQVRADIALDEAGRRGLAVDPQKVGVVRARLEEKVRGYESWLLSNAPDLFARDTVKKRLGQLMRNPRTGVPQISQTALREYLVGVAGEAGLDAERLPLTPKDRQVSTALGVWRDLAPDHPFVWHWSALMDAAKLLQFAVQLEGYSDTPPVTSDYHVLVRTGRTSCREPNIQQMPKEPWFREMFVARPGHKLVIADYAAIELVTLAAVLEHKYGAGTSALARVLREGRKPHDYTAALVMGVPYEDFLALKKTDPDLHKQRRQAAKAINFGVPGGLGAAKLALYAKANYGVIMTPEEAADLKNRLITEVYPELETYLGDDVAELLSRGLRCPVHFIKAKWKELTGWHDGRQFSMPGVVSVIAGLNKRNGDEYSEWFRARVWKLLRLCNCTKDPQLGRLLRAEVGSRQLKTWLLPSRVATLTGRVRAGVEYTEARNTPFQGLAADGAKVALWQLRQYAQDGWHTVAFLHDEIVVEVPEGSADLARTAVSDVMKSAMRSVLGTDLPVEVEAVVSDTWVK